MTLAKSKQIPPAQHLLAPSGLSASSLASELLRSFGSSLADGTADTWTICIGGLTQLWTGSGKNTIIYNPIQSSVNENRIEMPLKVCRSRVAQKANDRVLRRPSFIAILSGGQVEDRRNKQWSMVFGPFTGHCSVAANLSRPKPLTIKNLAFGCVSPFGNELFQLTCALRLREDQMHRKASSVVNLLPEVHMMVALDNCIRVGQVDQLLQEMGGVILLGINKFLPQRFKPPWQGGQSVMASLNALAVFCHRRGPSMKLPAHAQSLKAALAKHRFLGLPHLH